MWKATASTRGRAAVSPVLLAALVIAGWGAAACRLPPNETGRLIFETQWGGRGDGPGQCFNPSGIAVGPGGLVYVADSGNARLQVFTPDGEHFATWPVPATSRPTGLAVRADGTTLVADFTGDQVLVLGADCAVMETWRGGTAEVTDLTAPSGIALTPQGTVVVVEFMGQRVRELDSEGRFLRFIDGGPPAATYVTQRPLIPGMADMAAGSPMTRAPGNDTMPGGNPAGLYAFPSDAVVAPNGTLYVSNTHAYEILVFGPTREFSAAWGTKGSKPAQWEVPVGLDVDPVGNLYVADSANFRVQVVDPDGHPLLVSRADERWYETTRKIYSPSDVAVGLGGRLYVADFAAAQVQRFRVELP